MTNIRNHVALFRPKSAAATSGSSVSKLYYDVSVGLCTRPIKISPKMAVWPDYEIYELNVARIAGKSDDEIRRLVRELEAARKNLAVGQVRLPTPETVKGVQAVPASGAATNGGARDE